MAISESTRLAQTFYHIYFSPQLNATASQSAFHFRQCNGAPHLPHLPPGGRAGGSCANTDLISHSGASFPPPAAWWRSQYQSEHVAGVPPTPGAPLHSYSTGDAVPCVTPFLPRAPFDAGVGRIIPSRSLPWPDATSPSSSLPLSYPACRWDAIRRRLTKRWGNSTDCVLAELMRPSSNTKSVMNNHHQPRGAHQKPNQLNNNNNNNNKKGKKTNKLKQKRNEARSHNIGFRKKNEEKKEREKERERGGEKMKRVNLEERRRGTTTTTTATQTQTDTHTHVKKDEIFIRWNVRWQT